MRRLGRPARFRAGIIDAAALKKHAVDYHLHHYALPESFRRER